MPPQPAPGAWATPHLTAFASLATPELRRPFQVLAGKQTRIILSDDTPIRCSAGWDALRTSSRPGTQSPTPEAKDAETFESRGWPCLDQ